MDHRTAQPTGVGVAGQDLVLARTDWFGEGEGSGPRRCIGTLFAETTVKPALPIAPATNQENSSMSQQSENSNVTRLNRYTKARDFIAELLTSHIRSAGSERAIDVLGARDYERLYHGKGAQLSVKQLLDLMGDMGISREAALEAAQRIGAPVVPRFRAAA